MLNAVIQSLGNISKTFFAKQKQEDHIAELMQTNVYTQEYFESGSGTTGKDGLNAILDTLKQMRATAAAEV